MPLNSLLLALLTLTIGCVIGALAYARLSPRTSASRWSVLGTIAMIPGAAVAVLGRRPDLIATLGVVAISMTALVVFALRSVLLPQDSEMGSNETVIREDTLRGCPGISRRAIAELVARQPRTVLAALQIPGVGRKTTKRLLQLGLLDDPDDVQRFRPRRN